MEEQRGRLSAATKGTDLSPVSIHRGDRLLDTIYVCLNAHLQGVASVALEDMARSIVQEIHRYRGASAGAWNEWGDSEGTGRSGCVGRGKGNEV